MAVLYKYGKYETTEDMKVGYHVKVSDELETFWVTVTGSYGLNIQGQINNEELRVPYDKDLMIIGAEYIGEIRKPTKKQANKAT